MQHLLTKTNFAAFFQNLTDVKSCYNFALLRPSGKNLATFNCYLLVATIGKKDRLWSTSFPSVNKSASLCQIHYRYWCHCVRPVDKHKAWKQHMPSSSLCTLVAGRHGMNEMTQRYITRVNIMDDTDEIEGIFMKKIPENRPTDGTCCPQNLPLRSGAASSGRVSITVTHCCMAHRRCHLTDCNAVKIRWPVS